MNTKITMLGTTGTGKTCLMVGMYAIMRCGFNGFTFSTNLDDDNDLSRQWDRMIDGELGEDRWPASTAGSRDYSFQFNYAFRRVMGFDWLDYRGGALSDDSSNDDVQQLTSQILDSSCVMLCVPGDLLANSSVNAIINSRAKIQRMNMFLPKVRNEAERQKRDLPGVAIVITKYDYCLHMDRCEITERVRQLFHPLFAPDSNWLTTICPVTLGYGFSSADGSEADLDPQNVHLPVTFAVFCALRNQERAIRRRIQEESERQNEFQRQKNHYEAERRERDSFWNQLFFSNELEQLSGEIQQRQRAISDVMARIDENRSELDDVTKNTEHLIDEMLQKLPVYYNGEECEINVRS